jgi:hypothetical protein
MSRFAFGLRYFLLRLGSTLNTREHVIWSIDLTQHCPNLCDAVCAILITPTRRNCRRSRQLRLNPVGRQSKSRAQMKSRGGPTTGTA